MLFKCFASCSFGLESVVALELKKLGFKDVEQEDARVYFSSDKAGIAKANIWLRSADRVYIEISDFLADSFESLFEGVKSIDWEAYIPKDAAFPVNADSVKSKLFSVSDIQSVSKKAAAERLIRFYKSSLPETAEKYDIHIKLFKDRVSACLNTSGQGLNRRGYRAANVQAPIRETLAAGLVILTGWKGDSDFADPMCGSGTIAIEAAMIGANIAPGLNRIFDAEKWRIYKDEWEIEREKARSAKKEPAIVFASDIDRNALSAADRNAKAAGVELKIFHADIKDFSRKDCIVLSNPPYAERMGDIKSVHELYIAMGKALKNADRKYIITADDDFERFFGSRAARKRKLYNGNIRCNFYQFF